MVLPRRDMLAVGLASGVAAMLPAGVASAQNSRQCRATGRWSLMKNGGREGAGSITSCGTRTRIGSNHQNGPNMIYEPLAYYSAFADKTYMWLAESYEYTPDFKQLTIKTRAGIKWSDGVPFSAEDVAYTFNKLRDLGPKVRWGVDVQQALDEAAATDPNTVVHQVQDPRAALLLLR